MRGFLHQFDVHAAPDYGCRSLQAPERNVILGGEQTVYLRPARLEQRGHFVLRNLSLLHRLGKLPGDDLLDHLGLRLLKSALLLEEIIDARSQMLLAHCPNSLWRFRAVVRSACGVAGVFFMNPCSATTCSR